MQNEQTILLVDDVGENIDVLAEVLKGHDIVAALDGKTALEIVKNESIDLILLDIMMPDMDGFEVCEILKSNPDTARIPIIFLSAKNKSDDIKKGFLMGGVDYITKPFNPNELISRVETHLKLRAYEKDLEQKVQEEVNKNKLKQQMIHQQSKQASLGEMLMHIAHQWKQPLASLGSINLVQKSKLEHDIPISKEETILSIDKSERLIEFMSNTVDTFKDFYTPSYIREEFSLTDAVHKVLNIYDATLNYHNINIKLISHEKNNTFGNTNEFTQVVFSIINNARDIFKLRDTQEPTIVIEINDKKITISDNGGGVDENMLDTLFLPFKSSTNGNGVGLYIAKEIVEKNGGIIHVANSLSGAVFTVEYITWID